MLYGFIRIYVIAGTIIGFFIYRITFGRLLFGIYAPVIGFIQKIILKIKTKIKIYSKKLLKIPYKILYNINRKIRTFRNVEQPDVALKKKER
jgi:hypothetical protein